jgi:hypothetical protein
MTTLRLGYGPLLLLLYQAAPLSMQQDSLGRYRVSVGFASGQWENEEFSCDGQLLSATPVRHRSAGVQFDVWPNDRVRLTAFGGTASQSVGETLSADSQYISPYVEPFAGPFGGAQLAYEGQKLGLGVGVTQLSGTQQQMLPALYLRLGDMDKAHLRMDALTPNPALPSVAWGRIGIGVNTGHLRKAGGFFGLGLGPPDYSSKAAFLGELRFPIARRVMAQLHGLAGPGEKNTQWSLGAGLQFDFGRMH